MVRWTLALWCFAAQAWTANTADGVEEYRLKAAFVSKFAEFVEWPPEAWKSPSDPVLICVVGENPFGALLDQVAVGKIVSNRKLAVGYIADPVETAGCQVLFVSSSERKHFRSMLKETRTGVLTIGDTDNFIAEGGIIDLPLDGDRIRIDINLDAAEKARLRISSKLLGLAHIVKK